MRITVTGHRPEKLRSKTTYREVPRPHPAQQSLIIEGAREIPQPETMRVPVGHDGYDRNNPVRVYLREAFRTLLLSLVADAWCRGDRSPEVITGGALGIDQDFAGVALRAGVPYALYVPFPGQESRWPKESQRVYHEVVARASRVVLCHPEHPKSDGEAGRLLLARNLRMLEDGDCVAAVWDGSNGGTSHCVRAAHRMGKPVRNLWNHMRATMGEYEAQRMRALKDGCLCI